MRTALLALLLVHVAYADAPSRKQAESAARRWIENGEYALAHSVDPFLFDQDGKTCKKPKKAKDIVECMLADEAVYSIRNWAPTRLRIHSDATFASWQRDRRSDVIEKHRKELAKLEDHVFVHFDAPGTGGSWELVLAIKLDDQGEPVVDSYLGSFLPAPPHPIGEAGARALASSWVTAMADGNDSVQRSNAHRTGYPYWQLGLPISATLDCKPEMRATSSKQFLAIALCVATAKDADLLARLARAKWEILEDPADARTRAEKGQDHIGASVATLDRMASDHLLLYNAVVEGETRFEIVLAIRNDAENPVVDAAIANLY